MSRTINSIRDLAAAARGRRLKLGLSQAALAKRASVSRQWVNEFEAGKLTAELGLVLRLLDALGLRLQIEAGDEQVVAPSGHPIDLDALLDEYARR